MKLQIDYKIKTGNGHLKGQTFRMEVKNQTQNKKHVMFYFMTLYIIPHSCFFQASFTTLLCIKPIVSSQFHHPVGHINHNSFKNSQKSWQLWLMISWHSQTTLPKLPGPADLLYLTSRRSGPFFQDMLHNSSFKLLFSPGWTIAMLSWLVFQPVLSNLYN